MNLNCKLTLTDEQRNILKQRMAGKPVKALATRAEICQLVQEFIEEMLRYGSSSQLAGDEPEHDGFGRGPSDDWHDQCCKANALLRTRINKLQHRLDTK